VIAKKRDNRFWRLGVSQSSSMNFWNYACYFLSFEWIRNGTWQLCGNELLSITSARSLMSRNLSRREKLDKMASRFMSEIFRDRHRKRGLSRKKTGRMVPVIYMYTNSPVMCYLFAGGTTTTHRSRVSPPRSSATRGRLQSAVVKKHNEPSRKPPNSVCLGRSGST